MLPDHFTHITSLLPGKAGSQPDHLKWCVLSPSPRRGRGSE